ncbi:GSCFA domain-containing protein [Thalassospira lucentensis]|uniref:GSCFA domain-containing protein n=1 Tax=Thalassospira lucentensis TaxID=168935 RepID=UPI0029433CDF|nr:GSCFA domain-containing protein [Thalassospira lucentensis]WOI10904.1 GSCFA domain-containing protein [Thalassospira lucentensis]
MTLANPYEDLKQERFWRYGVALSDPRNVADIHAPKWGIAPDDTVVTMGSCFAQHIATWLRERDLNVPFFDTDDNIKSRNFSANYGNIYTVRQALQLTSEIAGKRGCSDTAWQSGNGFVDPLRPNVFASPVASGDAIGELRKTHLKAVEKAFTDLDILVFTLGLTEAWQVNACGTVLPVAPGVAGGDYDPQKYSFVNFAYPEIRADLEQFCTAIREMRGGRDFRLILTVSPVPLTATYEERHILQSTTYSKAVLRAVAGDFASENAFADYFPSFEIINNPAAKSSFFEDNFRSVKSDAVETVMNHFMASYFPDGVAKSQSAGSAAPEKATAPAPATATVAKSMDADCEDELLEGFASKRDVNARFGKNGEDMVVAFGDSHMVNSSKKIEEYDEARNFAIAPVRFLANNPAREINVHRFRTFIFKEEHSNFKDFFVQNPGDLVLVGIGLFGDNIIRAHGDMKPQIEGASGSDITPALPCLNGVTPELVQMYVQKITPNIAFGRQLEKMTAYKRIFWIVSPDMPEQTARFRLGDHFVDGGYYNVHKRAYIEAFKMLVHNLGRTKFILHPWPDLCNETGFTRNEFAGSDNVTDIHVNKDYYEYAVTRLLELMKGD